MYAMPGTQSPSNDNVLKTTTWGARLALVTAIFVLATGLSLADSKKHKLSHDLDAIKGGHDGATVDVIIQFTQTPTDAHHQKVRSKGGALKRKLDLIKGAHYSVPTAALDALADDPDIAYISPNRPLKGSLDHVVSAVNADLAYSNGWDGTGVGIAVIDSGVTSVNDLNVDNNSSSRIVYSQSFVAGDSSTADAFGHGTHIAGIIAGNGYSSSSSNYPGVYRGVASEAMIINLRALDSTGAGTDSSVIGAIQQAIALKNTYNI
jgi:serine protease AprX